ncbi:glycoside hydrolase family 99-like domain-containing protein, partial [Clostridium saccharoperbutylacetonicum]|uniref:glycoside hydrolase family 99-like domain-containing protein n=1 Tax=Clostridium saccharoperbutylacetonicum TaxID=36745 RepID=UPI000380F592
MNPKIIAFYLPQFHCIEENNKWWGNGFTEWTNTKKAKPLYKGHNQPKEPLNNRYYCLLDKKMQEWQCNLAEKYGIYGFCYYHYWFSGKKAITKTYGEYVEQTRILNSPFVYHGLMNRGREIGMVEIK